METKNEPGTGTCDCPVCAQRAEDEQIQEDLNFAILIALVPALAITLFSNMGLF